MFYFQKPILQKTIGISFLIIICLLWKTTLANPIIPFSGECPPTKDECQDSQGNLDEDCLRLKFEGNRQIILPKVNLYRESDLDEPIHNSQLAFRDQVTVLKEKVGYLRASLVRASNQRCGWIPENAILGSNPLLVKDIRGVEGFDDEDNKLNAKVLVRNLPDERVSNSVPLYDAVGGREIGRLKIFGIYNIYTYQNHQGKTYFLVGGQKVTENMLEPVLLGWVKADEVIPWSSAMNLYYAPGKTNIPIYGSEKDAINQANPIATQGNRHIEPEKNNIPRFPVLDHRKVNKDITLYKMAFAGEACISKNCISAREIAMRRGQLGEAIKNTEHIDILFVIDATESMDKYFKPVVKAVQSFATEIASNVNKVRFSVVAYGDYHSREYNQDKIQFLRAVPFSDTNNTEKMKRLVQVSTFDDPLKDRPEAAFAALIKAINKAKWRNVAGLRLVIWIGDHPNHNDDVLKTKDVVKALDAKKAIWSAINVKGKYRKSFNESFISQAKTISSQSGGWAFPIVKTYQSRLSKDTSTVQKRVKDKLHEIYDTSIQIAKQIIEITTTGKASPVDKLPSAILAERYIKERLNISEKDMRDIYSRTQLITQGYVRQHNNDFAFWISMSAPTFNKLHDRTKALCDALQYRSNYDDIREAMMGTLEVVTGDKPSKNDNIGQFLSKRLNVPKENFSELLDQSLNEFVRWYVSPDTPEKKTQFKSNICLKAAMLDQVANNKRVDMKNDMMFDERQAKWQPKPGAKIENFNWMWGAENGIRYFYIPLEYIP
jgi:hypothetical protein